MSIQLVIQKAAKLIIQTLSSYYQKKIIITSSITSIDDNKQNSYNIFYTIKDVINDFLIYEPFETQELNQKFHVIIKTILMSLRSLDNNNQEYNLCLLLLCKLLMNGIDSSISFLILKKGYIIAMKSVIYSLSHALTPVKIIINWNDYHQLLQLINCRLTSHTFIQWFNVKIIEEIADNILNSFILLVKPILITHSLSTSIHSNINNSITEIQISLVIYHKIVGLSIDNTKIYGNELWMDIPLAMECIQAFGYHNCNKGLWYNEDLIVIIFECSLEFPELNKGESIEMTDISFLTYHNNCESSAMISLEYQYMNKFVKLLKENHVTLVACQKRIHPYLERKLLSNGILCISRISIRFIGALQRLTGARQLGAIPNSINTSNTIVSTNTSNTIDSSGDTDELLTILDISCLGYLHSVRKENIQGKQFVIACGYSSELYNNNNQDIYDVLYKRLELKLINHNDLYIKKLLNGFIDRYKPCISILITSPSEALVHQIKNVYEETLNYLLTMLSRSLQHSTLISDANVIYLLPGAGCWQAYIATCFQLQCSNTNHMINNNGTNNNSSSSNNNDNNNDNNNNNNVHNNNNSNVHYNNVHMSYSKSIESALNIYTKCLFDIANIVALGKMNYNVNINDDNNEESLHSNEFIFPSTTTNINNNANNNNKDYLYFKSISGEEIVAKMHSQDRIYKLVSGTSLDCYETNIKAIQIATELSCSLLELDDVVYIK